MVSIRSRQAGEERRSGLRVVMYVRGGSRLEVAGASPHQAWGREVQALQKRVSDEALRKVLLCEDFLIKEHEDHYTEERLY